MGKFSRLLVFVSEEGTLIQGVFGKSRQEQSFAAAERERISCHVQGQAALSPLHSSLSLLQASITHLRAEFVS